MSEKKKISYLLSHPIQYFSPLFRQMAADEKIDLTVYYCSDPTRNNKIDKGFGTKVTWDIPLLDGYKSVFLKNFSRSRSLDNRFWSLINFGIIGKVTSDKSDILIVHGWSYFTNYLAIVTAWLLHKKVWLRGENPFHQELMKPKVTRFAKKIVLQYFLFKMIGRFLYIGQHNREFYTHYGVKETKLIYAPYSVDNSFFQSSHAYWKNQKESLRAKHGLRDEAVVILFSGKYIAKKRPLDVLAAFKLVKQDNVSLVMVGEGELRGQLQEYIHQNDLKNVILTGFVNQSEIGQFYSLADIFVLPSGTGETWGLVVNEAMLFGLPIVVSATVGSARDLVRIGENGFVYEEGDVQQLACNLSILIGDKQRRARAGKASQRIIADFNYDVMISNIKKEL